MGAAVSWEMRVTYEDGRTPQTVSVDQRDLAALELEPWYDPARRMVHNSGRYMAWHALKRQGQTDLSWPKWNGVVVLAEDVVEDDGEGEQSVPPGRQTARGPR